MKIYLSLFAFLLLAITGCVSPAKKLDPSLISQIQEGTTTRPEVEKLLGQPKNTTVGANRKTLVFYKFLQAYRNPGWVGVAEGNAGTLGLRTLTLLYDEGHKVEKMLLAQSSTVVKRDPGGVTAGLPVPDEVFQQIKKGITSRGEIIQWMGKPTMQSLNVEGERVLAWEYVRDAHQVRLDEKQTFFVVIAEDEFVKDFGKNAGTLW